GRDGRPDRRAGPRHAAARLPLDRPAPRARAARRGGRPRARGVPSVVVTARRPPAHAPGRHAGARAHGRRRRRAGRHRRGRRRRPFRYRDKGNVATIGRARAVADLHVVRLSGFPAWITWLVVHLFYLVGFRNRLLVLLSWALSFVTRGRGARIIRSDAPR